MFFDVQRRSFRSQHGGRATNILSVVKICLDQCFLGKYLKLVLAKMFCSVYVCVEGRRVAG